MLVVLTQRKEDFGKFENVSFFPTSVSPEELPKNDVTAIILDAREAPQNPDLLKLADEIEFFRFPKVLLLSGMPGEEDEDNVMGWEEVCFSIEELPLRVKHAVDLVKNRKIGQNHLTGLPDSISSERAVNHRIREDVPTAFALVDLSSLKAINEKYGYQRGDLVIVKTAKILKQTLEECAPSHFLGHRGGDNFIFFTDPELVERCCEEFIKRFEETKEEFYDPEDYTLGVISIGDVGYPLIFVSIGVVTSTFEPITSFAKVLSKGYQLIEGLVNKAKSCYAINTVNTFGCYD